MLGLMRDLGTYWHTVRHLKPVQVYGRIWRRVRQMRVDDRAPPARRETPSILVEPAHRYPSLVGPRRFCFLNETRELESQDWDDPSWGLLWRFNLHYFDDLNARGAESRVEWHRALLLCWVRDNPPGKGTGWEAYPTSLRIVNWIKWALAGNELPRECVHSLAVQTRWLSRGLEHHLLGNHLFANAKALVFAGLFFEGHEADAWLDEGMEILALEMPEQILPDGGQFERSPMYHALALNDMLDLYNVAAAYAPAMPTRWRDVQNTCRVRIELMRGWLATMCHPDGEIGFFNDAAIGIAPRPADLERYATRLGFATLPERRDALIHLSPSGYIRVESREAVALIDVAPVGPDYLPGHAHADTLSFELSLFGQRVLVNSGTSRYGVSAERLRQRGTAAHNTVIVDGQNSTEVWAGFRVARRATPTGLEVIRNSSVLVRCAHDGYRRLPGRPQHQRQWTFGDNVLEVRDRISGKFGHAEARFHLHPSVQIDEVLRDSTDADTVGLHLPGGGRVDVRIDGGTLRNEATTWHPEFGRSEPNACLVVEFTGSVIATRLTWTAVA